MIMTTKAHPPPHHFPPEIVYCRCGRPWTSPLHTEGCLWRMRETSCLRACGLATKHTAATRKYQSIGPGGGGWMVGIRALHPCLGQPRGVLYTVSQSSPGVLSSHCLQGSRPEMPLYFFPLAAVTNHPCLSD